MSEKSKYLLDLDNNILNYILYYISNEEDNYFYLYKNIKDLFNTCKSLNKLKYYFSYFELNKEKSLKYYHDENFRNYLQKRININKQLKLNLSDCFKELTSS